MEKHKNKILILGLDAADIDLVEQWGREGHLPALWSLMQGEAWSKLDTTTDLAHTSVWPTLFTGTSPGKHGIYNFVQLNDGTYEASRVWADQRAQPNFWEYLDREDKKCIILDAPFDCPIDGFSGVQIMEWGTWVRYWKQEGLPRGLWNNLVKRFDRPPIEPGAIVKQEKEHELTRMRDWLVKGALLKGRAIKWLITEHDWDLFLAVFAEPHPAGHYFWDLDSPGSPSQNGGSPSKYLREVYSAVDQAVGEIVCDLDDDVSVFIVSGDGIGPNYSGWHFLPDVLRNLGFFVLRGGGFVESSGGTVSNQNSLFNRIRTRIPSEVRMGVSRLLPETVRLRLWRQGSKLPVEWSSTRAYFIPNECQGHIRINVKGRDPSGCVSPGVEYDRVCEELTDKLLELEAPQTKTPAVQGVVRTDTIFAGAKRSHLPDLILIWNEQAKVTTELYSKSCGLLTKPHAARDLSPYYVGNHKSPGFVLCKGPQMRSGSLMNKRHIVDFTPTILNMFGIAPSGSMTGRIWDDLWCGT